MDFFKGKSVLVTGHTGFKGAWLCEVLKKLGARVVGYSLPPKPGCLFEMLSGGGGMQSYLGDIRDYENLCGVFAGALPEIVFHLAAQPLVLDSYAQPLYTFETNVIGTANLLECVRQVGGVRSVVVVTTDKVYRNIESAKGYCEEDELGGSDPYSYSKACAELVAASYKESFLRSAGVAVSAARAGNVIGGGDIAENRIVPDCVRAAESGGTVLVRNPNAVRPYQHVLDPLFAYLQIAEAQWGDPDLADCYNIGPNETECVTTEVLVDIFCRKWGDGVSKKTANIANAPHEAGLLYLDCAKIRNVLGWVPVWNTETAVEKTVEWEKARLCGGHVDCTQRQIEDFLG